MSSKKDLSWFTDKVGETITVAGTTSKILILTDKHALSIYDLHKHNQIDFTFDSDIKLKAITLDNVISANIKVLIGNIVSPDSLERYVRHNGKKNPRWIFKLRKLTQFKQALIEDIKLYFESLDITVNIKQNVV